MSDDHGIVQSREKDERLLTRFGKYFLLDQLAKGGMGTIYRARELAESIEKIVAEKIVAIKVIKEEHSTEQGFKEMFLDEIKVAYGLTHPNIMQTYNYGERDGQLFAVLEYIFGKTFKEYADTLKQQKKQIPLEHIVYIISQSCQGLDYAHKFTDRLTGKKQKLVHRDISPQNLMLDYEGLVKVIDFGIAKAESNTEATKTGTIKGKVSYIAPEYLMDDIELDGRYDQFAIGLTMWELLVGEKLFGGSNDMAILKKIYECRIPTPRTINPNIPEDLEKILLKSLSRNRDDRFSDMEEFNRALTKFLYSKFPDYSSSSLKDYLNKEFAVQIKKEREKLQQFGKIDMKPYCAELKEELENLSGTKNINAFMSAKDDSNVTAKQKLMMRRENRNRAIDSAQRDIAKKLVWGATSITDETDRTISPFILMKRKMKEGNKTGNGE